MMRPLQQAVLMLCFLLQFTAFGLALASTNPTSQDSQNVLPERDTYGTQTYFYNYVDGSSSSFFFDILPSFADNDTLRPNQILKTAGSLSLLLHFNPNQSTENSEALASWLSQPDIVSRVPDFYGEDYSGRGTYDKPTLLPDIAKTLRTKPLNTTFDQCKIMYKCAYAVLPTFQILQGIPFQTGNPDDVSSVQYCLSSLYNTTRPLTCPLVLTKVGKDLSASCSGSQAVSSDTWFSFQVDRQLQIFLESGVDDNGIWWPGLQAIPYNSIYTPPKGYIASYSFANAIGRQILGSPSFDCSLETKCASAADCRSVGSRTALGLGSQPYPEFWTFAVLTSLENMSTQLSNQYIAIKGAAIVATLGTFKIGDFYYIPQPNYSLLNILSGLSTAFAILSGFLPIGGAIAGAASATLGAASGYLGRYVTNATASQVPQQVFSDAIVKIYTSFIDGLDSLGKALFTGQTIGEGVSIATMMQGGAWVDSNTLQSLNETEKSLAIEIISRAVNQLWKTPPYNKTFVTFVSLGDKWNDTGRCQNDTTGPQMFKYCADGGVYYAYNFIEDGHGQAHLALPWGADKLEAKYDIKPAWISEASAKTYRLSQINATERIDPFNVTGEDATSAFINNTLSNGELIDPTSFAGRSPGSWSLPVCATYSWGKNWNWDYINGNPKLMQRAPCLCGPNGTETKDFVQAAGLKGSGAYYRTCKDALTDKLFGFKWPPGVAEANLGYGDVIKKPK